MIPFLMCFLCNNYSRVPGSNAFEPSILFKHLITIFGAVEYLMHKRAIQSLVSLVDHPPLLGPQPASLFQSHFRSWEQGDPWIQFLVKLKIDTVLSMMGCLDNITV